MPGEGDQAAWEVMGEVARAGFEGHVVLEVSTRRATSRHEREVLLGEALRNTQRALAVGASRD